MPFSIRVTDLKTGIFDAKVEESTRRHNKSSGDCEICLEKVEEYQYIWSCMQCRIDFHLVCIKIWFNNERKQSTPFWTCPNCRVEIYEPPLFYYCYCGKTRNPQLSDNDNRVNSHCCGNVCGIVGQKSKGSHCTHPCVSQCHPGFCPPCNSTINVSCPCGKQTISIQCNAYNKKEEIVPTCGALCNKLLNCNEHSCELKCHHSSCYECKVVKNRLTCYCGKLTKDILCGSGEENITGFSCPEICNKVLECENHRCQRACHDDVCGPCPLDPSILRFCSCGKKPILEILSQERTSCLEQVPSCNLVCGERLNCRNNYNDINSQRHRCQRVCHSKNKHECAMETVVKCMCKKTGFNFHCSFLDTSSVVNLRCEKKCEELLNCRKHICQNVCCLHDDSQVQCELICGNLLDCKIHTCRRRCHSGSCGRCTEVVNTPISCNCGDVVRRTNLPCHKFEIKCSNMCPKSCSSCKQKTHPCHDSRLICPPCESLTSRMCYNNHKLLSNVVCSVPEIFCTTVCNKKLKCGHGCSRFCHRGPCLDGTFKKCEAVCEKIKTKCPHECKEICHYPRKCNPNICGEIVIITCECKYRAYSVTCQDYRWMAKIIADKCKGFAINNDKLILLRCIDQCFINKRNFAFATALGLPVSDDPDFCKKIGDPVQKSDLVTILTQEFNLSLFDST